MADMRMQTPVRQTTTGRRVKGLGWAACSLVAVGFGATPAAQAARTLYWDPQQTAPTAGASGGSGTWKLDDSAGYFTTAAPPATGSNTAWQSGDQNATANDYATAVFGAVGGTVVVQGQSYAPIRFGKIQFTTSGYTLTPGVSFPNLETRGIASEIATGTGGYSNQIDAPLIAGLNAMPINVTGNGTLTLGGSLGGAAQLVLNDSVTVVLAKASVPGGVRAVAGNTLTPGLQVNAGTTVRLAGTGGDQVRDRAKVVLNGGTLDMNGRSEAVGPATFDGATVMFTVGSALGDNDVLTLTNGASEIGAAAGAATVTGVNTIHIAPRAGVTGLAEGDYTLITASGGLGTAAWTLASTSIVVGGNTYSLSLDHSTATAQVLTVSLVPEPASLALLGAGCLALVRRRAGAGERLLKKIEQPRRIV